MQSYNCCLSSTCNGSPRFPYLLKNPKLILSTRHYIITIYDLTWLICWETIGMYKDYLAYLEAVVALKYLQWPDVQIWIRVCSCFKTQIIFNFQKKIRYIFKMWVMLRHRSGVNKKDTFKLQIYITCYLKMTFFDLENYNSIFVKYQ